MNNYEERPILIILIAGIGDLVLGSKAMRAIRNGFPDRKIYLLTSTEAAPLARNYKYIDEVIAFPIRELRRNKSHLINIWRLLLDLRKNRFDIAVNLYQVSTRLGALKMGSLFTMLKARTKIGHDCRGFGLFLDKKVPADAFSTQHYADAMMEIATLAGGRPDDRGIEVFWNKASDEKWAAFFKQNAGGARKTIVGINPGGDRPNRRWDVARYAAVADLIIEQYGAHIVIFGGPGEEHISLDIQSRMKHKATDLAGKLTLDELVYVISRLDLLITNDSGPMHMSAAVRTPQVAIFGPENPAQLRPYASPDTYRIMYKSVACRPCTTAECSHVSCLRNITSDEVFEAAKTLLGLNACRTIS